jgi:hypothetical protein
VQNAFVESFDARMRDECLNLHWFRSLAHAHDEITDGAAQTPAFGARIAIAHGVPDHDRSAIN